MIGRLGKDHMECINGHLSVGQVNFCPICGTTSFKDAETSGTVQAPGAAPPSVQFTGESRHPWYRSGAVIVAAAILIAAVIVAVVVATKNTVPPTTVPRTTVPIAVGPSLSYMQRTTLKDFNKQESASGTQSNCTYDRTKWAPGYKFTCFIYNKADTGIGSVVITSTSSASASEYTWNEQFSLS